MTPKSLWALSATQGGLKGRMLICFGFPGETTVLFSSSGSRPGKWSGRCSQEGLQRCVTQRPEEWSRHAQNRATMLGQDRVTSASSALPHTLSLSLPLSLSVCLSLPLCASIHPCLSLISVRVNTDPLSTFFPRSRITNQQSWSTGEWCHVWLHASYIQQ